MSECIIAACDFPPRGKHGLCHAHAERRRRGYPLDSPISRRLPFERCYAIADSGCWEWLGKIHSSGYGRFHGTVAHRWSYEQSIGPIPDGLQIDHLCRNRSCVNPDHLEPVTSRENSHRGEHPNHVAHRENRCTRGHEFDETNTYYRTNGTRLCRKCKVIRQQRAGKEARP